MAYVEENEWKHVKKIRGGGGPHPNFNIQLSHQCRLGHCHEIHGHCQCVHCYETHHHVWSDEWCESDHASDYYDDDREVVLGKDINRESQFFDDAEYDYNSSECLSGFNAVARAAATCANQQNCQACSAFGQAVCHCESNENLSECSMYNDDGSSSDSFGSAREYSGRFGWREEFNCIRHVMGAISEMAVVLYYVHVCLYNYVRCIESAIFSRFSRREQNLKGKGAGGEGAVRRRRSLFSSDYPNWAKLWSQEARNTRKASFVTFVNQILLYVFALTLVPYVVTCDKNALFIPLADILLSGVVWLIVRIQYGKYDCCQG